MVLDSAARLGVAAHAWLYRDGERVVGHMSSIPVRVTTGETERLSEWFVDTKVLESHRSQAPGTKLMVEAQAQVPFALSLGQTPEMREIQFRLGWSQVAPLQTAQLLLRAERVLKGKMPAPLAWAAGVGLGASRGWRSPRWRRAVAPRPVTAFGAEHDALWQRMSREIPCAVVRDASYLTWKYLRQPGQRFSCIEVLDHGAPVAVAVITMREADEHYRYRRAFLVDLVVVPSDADLVASALEAVCDVAMEAGADAITCLHVGDWLGRALRQCGFMIRTPERYLLVLPGNLSDGEQRRVLDGASWYVTQGDSDIDRPSA
jgi:hypothetical protein